MAEATPIDVTRQTAGVTECSICLKTYTKPKILPCAHSFCAKCIEEYGKDKKPEEKLTCPLCRSELTVPSGGLGDLPKNDFLERICDIGKLSSKSAVKQQCDACLAKDEVGDAATADTFCLDCRQHLCERCAKTHSNLTHTKSHKVVARGCEESCEMSKSWPTYCKEHNERVTRYCLECKENLCLECFMSSHNSHKCPDIVKAADDIGKQLQTNIDKTAELLKIYKEKVTTLIEEKLNFAGSVEKTKLEVIAWADKLKKMIDEHANKFVEEVDLVKDKTHKEMELLLQECEFQVTMLENYHRYLTEVTLRGCPVDVCRAAADFEVKANELKFLRPPGFASASATFTPSEFKDLLSGDRKNVVGEMKITSLIVFRRADVDLSTLSAKLLHTITCSGNITGLTAIADCIFVTRRQANAIEVYDSNSFAKLRQMSVTSLQSAADMTSCVGNQCLYVSDYAGRCVHNVALSGAATNWPVVDQPNGISVTDNFNIVVSFTEAQKIREYKSDGSCVLEVCLKQHAVALSHAVRLDGDTFVVCQGLTGLVGAAAWSAQSRVLSIKHDGRIVNFYGSTQGSGVGQLYGPWNLSVDGHGHVLVADYNNHRLSLFSESLTHVRDVIPAGPGIQNPTRLHLDYDSRRVYVGLLNGPVLVYGLS